MSWGPLTLVPGSEHGGNGGPRAVALRDAPGTVLLTNSRGKLWRSSDSGLSWSAPVAMFSGAQHLEGGGVMIQLSAAHQSHPNRILAVYDQSLPWNTTTPCGSSPYSRTWSGQYNMHIIDIIDIYEKLIRM